MKYYEKCGFCGEPITQVSEDRSEYFKRFGNLTVTITVKHSLGRGRLCKTCFPKVLEMMKDS